MTQEQTRPDAATRQAEAEAARTGHDADRDPSPEEARAAESNAVDPAVARAHEEANERGAAQKGEGRVA